MHWIFYFCSARLPWIDNIHEDNAYTSKLTISFYICTYYILFSRSISKWHQCSKLIIVIEILVGRQRIRCFLACYLFWFPLCAGFFCSLLGNSVQKYMCLSLFHKYEWTVSTMPYHRFYDHWYDGGAGWALVIFYHSLLSSL